MGTLLNTNKSPSLVKSRGVSFGYLNQLVYQAKGSGNYFAEESFNISKLSQAIVEL